MKGKTTPSKGRHPIQVVARRTGLTPDVIRVWERRYAAVEPRRSTTNRRLYSDQEVERLRLLRRATLAGRRIGDVAGLSLEELRDLVAEDDRAASPGESPGGARHPGARGVLEDCRAAVDSLDPERLENVLSSASVNLSTPVLLEQVLMPLMHGIGKQWRSGELRPFQEHMATAVIRTFLGNLSARQAAPGTGPEIVVTTPAGQIHELGAMTVAATAALDGWRVTYLGPTLPAPEIAAAVVARDARAVALSIVHPADDAELPGELRTLGKLLPRDTRVIAGGSAAAGYAPVLREIDAVVRDDMAGLRSELENLRARAS